MSKCGVILVCTVTQPHTLAKPHLLTRTQSLRKSTQYGVERLGTFACRIFQPDTKAGKRANLCHLWTDKTKTK